MKNKNLHYSSLAAGMLIAVGCCLYCSIENKIVGAICFSLGLLAIRIFKLNLFTGKTQFFLDKNSPYNWYEILLILVGNLVGVSIIRTFVLLFDQSLASVAYQIGRAKDALPINQLFFSSFICGMLMTIATYKDSPLWVSTLAVAAFILGGFNHCIADAFYLSLYNPSLKIFIIIIGNLLGGRTAGLMTKLKGLDP